MASKGPRSDLSQLQALSEAINYFGILLYKKLSPEEANIFLSPLSLSNALTIAFCGAREETAVEMRKVLGYEKANIGDDEVSCCFRLLLTSLFEAKESYSLKCANIVFGQHDYDITEDFKILLEKSFQAMLMKVDFDKESEKAVQQANDWVKEKTNGMIPILLEKLDAGTKLVILNAVYFKGFWKNKFKEQATYKRDFYNNGVEDSIVQVDMMPMKESFLFTQNDSFSALQLPYLGEEVSMLILLPNARTGLEALENKISLEFLKEIKSKMRKRKVNVGLPKFRLEYNKSLKEQLQSLGMNLAFSDGAHFGGISDSRDLFISQIIHKAVVIVNEEGCEAAAATAVVMMKRSLSLDPEFIVDHPFLFLIHNVKTDLILFIGKVKEL